MATTGTKTGTKLRNILFLTCWDLWPENEWHDSESQGAASFCVAAASMFRYWVC